MSLINNRLSFTSALQQDAFGSSS
uniref:Uncharacterized protein n=1 Tax=Arundo donax TaxID=35708 RepID=A0A0A9EI28_ARUDO